MFLPLNEKIHHDESESRPLPMLLLHTGPCCLSFVCFTHLDHNDTMVMVVSEYSDFREFSVSDGG